VERIRIYRTVGGEYLFVEEFYTAAYSPPYNDALLDAELAEPLISQNFYPPPANLKGLIGLACGSLAGFYDNKVAFSEPYQPGAWPPEYEKIFDYNVVALGTFGQTCVVATSGYTYLVSGSDPRSFTVARVPDPYPCGSKKSMASADNGVIYASQSGLVFIGNASGSFAGVYMVTRQLMTKEDWARYSPGIIGTVSEGRYYGFYVVGNPYDPGNGFVYDFNNNLESLITGVATSDSDDKTDILVDLQFYASAVYAAPNSPLYMVTQTLPLVGPNYENLLYLWDGGATYAPYQWRSKEFSFPYAVSFSAAKIIFNDHFPKDPAFTFRMFDGAYPDVPLYQRLVTNSTPFRLPSLKPRTEWRFEVEGASFVQMIEISSSYQDLAERKA
jgi:hypothetical protein